MLSTLPPTRAREEQQQGRERGRYVRSAPPREGETQFEIAVDATLRARAVERAFAGSESAAGLGRVGQREKPTRPGLRKKVRRRPGGRLVVFLVDASESMSGRYQLVAAREAAVGMLRSDKTGHDRGAIVSFQNRSARVLLNPTRSSIRAARTLGEVSPRGSTPLAAGLAKAGRVMRFEAMRSGQGARVLIVLSDGRGNVALSEGGNARRDTARAAEELRRIATHSVVVDTAPAEEGHEEMQALTDRLRGSYHWIGSA